MKTQPERQSAKDLFIVDNSHSDWTASAYLEQWCKYALQMDIATGYFEIGSLLELDGHWQEVDKFRILMGDEVSLRTRGAFDAAFKLITARLDDSLENEKRENVYLNGVSAIKDSIASGKIECRVYRKDKFHAKAYITHARDEVLGSAALVGSSNFTRPGLCDNIELNVRLSGTEVPVLQDWFEAHWNDADEVSADILKTIARHTEDHSPFELYAHSLHHLFRDAPSPAREWELGPVEEGNSKIFKVLSEYQRDGYKNLVKIANQYDGAFLCDGVGLGKTFVGMMLLERFVRYERKNVVLIVPKAARKAVWEASLERFCPELLDPAFSRLQIINHTDITRKASQDVNWPNLMANIREKAEVVIIDEAHHFRNPGVQVDVDSDNPNLLKAKDGREPSRYRRLYHMLEPNEHGPKKVFLLTATPVNNHLSDLRHMMELFTRKEQDHFASCGIQSLSGHFRSLERDLDAQANGNSDIFTDADEAQEFLSNDKLFKEVVVQRSRTYVKKSQEIQEGSSSMFPTREPPRVAEYNVRKTYGDLLDAVEKAFSKKNPLFRLAIYNPSAYALQPDESKESKIEENRQVQAVGLVRTGFLKRFESSAKAFESSCERLFIKMLAWVTVNCETDHERDQLDKWKLKYEKIIGRVQSHFQIKDLHQQDLFADEEDAEEDIITEEMKMQIEKLDREHFKVGDMIDDTLDDLRELTDFLQILQKLNASHDDKLKKLIKMLKTEIELKGKKVLIFSEFSDTARYISNQLIENDIDGVQLIDGSTSPDNRLGIIERFSPYYNGSSTQELNDKGREEIRIIVSTDVLSEGLNLQDATRMINYDLHWNPVRLMQRIGRVDRRMSADIEAAIVRDHPNLKKERGRIVYWNFLPPDDLDKLLKLYEKVSKKTLRISTAFGIEGKQLLTPEDDFNALKDLNAKYDGQETSMEALRNEYNKLLKDHPELEERLDDLPGQVFSGKQYPADHQLSGRAVFFCYSIPAYDSNTPEQESLFNRWTEEAGETVWLLLDLETGDFMRDPPEIANFIRSTPETPREVNLPKGDFEKARKKAKSHIDKAYLRPRNAPAGVNARLIAWMELH